MTRGAAFFAAVLVTIGRPTWWAMALAAFLLRGGIVIAILPIVTLPSALALSNAFAPMLLPLALGRIDPALIAWPAAVVVAFLAWLVGGGRIAAGIDVAFVGEAAAAALEEGVAGGDESAAADGEERLTRARRRAGVARAWRILAVRLIAWLPLALALGFGVAQIVEATYVELTRPVDVVTPIAVRVAREVAGVFGLILVTWIVGEVMGGVATRGIVLGRGAQSRSLAGSLRTGASGPLSWLVPWLATSAALVIVFGFTLAAAAAAWTRAVDALSRRAIDPVATGTTLLLFVGLWLAAMFLGGVGLAVRGAAQTFEYVRRSPAGRPNAADQAISAGDAPGTFGAPTRSRPGDWSRDDEGGSL
ncbi:MAG: hypothetical protein ACJ765_13180 [Chloroflexota bacterium]